MSSSEYMKYRIDDWVLYCAFPEIKALGNQRDPAVVLEVYPAEDYYDYRIFIDGTGRIKKVKQRNLFPFKK